MSQMKRYYHDEITRLYPDPTTGEIVMTMQGFADHDRMIKIQQDQDMEALMEDLNSAPVPELDNDPYDSDAYAAFLADSEADRYYDLHRESWS